jgi:hypothetical protein
MYTGSAMADSAVSRLFRAAWLGDQMVAFGMRLIGLLAA